MIRHRSGQRLGCIALVRSDLTDLVRPTGAAPANHGVFPPGVGFDGLEATKVAWNQATHSFEDTGLPDHKERRESARAIIEYVVGKAIERSMEVSGSYKELSTLIEEIKASPEAMRLLPSGLFESLLNGNSEPFTTESSESEPVPEARPTPEDSEQKAG
jgi:hypothetical protein